MILKDPWVGPGKPNLPLGLRGKAGGGARVTAGPKPSCDPQKSPDTPGSPEGNTEGPGTASSEPLLPS